MKNAKYYLSLLLLAIIITCLNKAQDIAWTRKADLPTGGWLGAAIVCNNNIYVIGGRGPEQWAIYEYNPLADEWCVKSFLPDYFTDGLIAHLAVGAIDNKIYIVGGTDEGNTMCYDPVTDQWQILAPIPTLRYHTTYCVLNNELHVIGGSFGRNQPATEHEVFNPLSNTWQKKTPVRFGGGAVTVNDKLYLIGGVDLDPTNLSQVRLYNPDENTWDKKCGSPTPPLGYGLAVLDKSIYVIGGQINTDDGNEEITSNTFTYNTVNNSWIQINDFPQEIHFSQTAVIGDKIYVIGGCDKDYNIYKSVWCGEVSTKNNLDSFGQTPSADSAEIFAPGIISTDDFEFAVTFNPAMNELFFTRRKPGETNKIYTMKLADAKWSEPRLAFFSKDYFDFEPHISPDGNKLYFGSFRPVGNKGGLHQWCSDRLNGTWTEPKVINAPFANEKIMMYLTSSKNQTIYFTIIRDGKNSGLFYSENTNGKYNSLNRLPKSINQHDSITAAHSFIAPDESYIIYDFENDEGFGDCDLYISFRKNDGSWTKSKNMGNKINTNLCEMCASVSPDGKYLFFHRGNDKDIGNIYWIRALVIDEIKKNVLTHREDF